MTAAVNIGPGIIPSPHDYLPEGQEAAGPHHMPHGRTSAAPAQRRDQPLLKQRRFYLRNHPPADVPKQPFLRLGSLRRSSAASSSTAATIPPPRCPFHAMEFVNRLTEQEEPGTLETAFSTRALRNAARSPVTVSIVPGSALPCLQRQQSDVFPFLHIVPRRFGYDLPEAPC